MVEETIKAIRETEAAADVIVKEAGEKSQKILEDARQEAERMIKSQEETHRISAQDAIPSGWIRIGERSGSLFWYLDGKIPVNF